MTPAIRLSHSRRPAGFTLLELIASIAVFSLLVVMLSQIISSSGEVIRKSRDKLERAGQARQVLDRLGMDLATRLVRSDVTQELLKAPGNDSLRFYSEMNGYAGQRRVALIGYRIQQATGDRSYQLERGATGCDWEGSSVLSLAAPSLPAPVDADYEVLSGKIFRMEFCFLRKSDGKLTNIPPAQISDIAAIVVAVAAIDSAGRLLLTDTQLQKLVEDLPDPAEGENPGTLWQQALTKPGFGTGLPLKAIQAIDIHERYYPLL